MDLFEDLKHRPYLRGSLIIAQVVAVIAFLAWLRSVVHPIVVALVG